jgi:hypothetical protein
MLSDLQRGMVAVVAGVGIETVIQSQVQGGAGMSVEDYEVEEMWTEVEYWSA